MNLYPYYDVVRDVSGNAVASATVNIYLTRDGSLAAVYDKAGNPVTLPLITDPSGAIVNGAASEDGIGFWAPAGRYRVEVSSGAQVAALPEIQLGPQITKLDEATDLDTILQPGVYDVFLPVNSPDGAASTTWWYVEVVRHSQSTDNMLQVATRMAGGTDERHFRLRKTAVWGPWTRLIDSADPDAASRINISDAGENFTAANVEDALAEEADARQAFEATKGQADGLAPLDANAKIPTTYLPALSITDVNVVASEAEQLALTVQEGDVAVRSDISTSYIHNGGTAGTMADWTELQTPPDAVLSVFGRTGTVSAQSGDYTAAQIPITDAGGVFTAAEVESALAELAAAGIAHQTDPDPHPQYATDTDLNTHTSNVANPHQVTASQVGLGNVQNVDTTAAANVNITDAGGNFAATNVEEALAEEADARQAFEATKGQADGLAPLDANAKIPTTYLPALSITDVNVVASEAEQLALTVQEGDVAVRSDLNKSFVHIGGTAGTMADWQELLTPTDAVLSVFGRTGAVTAQSGDYTAAQITVADSGGNFTATDVEGALAEIPGMIDAAKTDYFTESRHTTTPNDTVPVHSWEVFGAETDIDLALTPKGAGAITAQIADGTTAAGNKRGKYAVDFQRDHGIVSGGPVASGDYSAIVNGRKNTASGYSSFVGGGYGNEATNNYSASICGWANMASGYSSVIGGGMYNVADGDESCIPGGRGAHTLGLTGKFAYSSQSRAFQSGLQTYGVSTTDATVTTLQSTGQSVVIWDHLQPRLPDNSVWVVRARIVARDTTTHDVKAWEIKAVVKRAVGVSTTAFVGTPYAEILAEDAVTTNWDCQIVVDTTRGTAPILVTGEVGKNIYWSCEYSTCEQNQ